MSSNIQSRPVSPDTTYSNERLYRELYKLSEEVRTLSVLIRAMKKKQEEQQNS